MKNSRTVFTMAVSLLLLSMASLAHAAGTSSVEFMCKTKAKEIAAETYRGCVVENKQAQVEHIRKEYQTKLAELKNQYNSELKQISGKKANKSSASSETSSTEMPAKKMKSSTIKSEKIDFSAGDQPESTNAEVATETEVVEIPAQQE